MKATWMLLIAVAGCGAGAKSVGGSSSTKGGDRADISPVRADLNVYTDGKGHYLPLVEPDPEKEVSTDLALFYGDGKAFHAAKVSQFWADGMKFEIGFQDPRIPASPAGSVKRELGKVTLSCWGTDVELTRLPDPEAQAMVGAGTFYKNNTKYSPIALAKQGDNYIYVDYEVGEKDKIYRVFTGKKGGLESLTVKDAKYDEHDNTFTFVTDKGTLVATRDPDAKEYAFGLAWEGKKEPWQTLGRSESWHVIYDELGVYRSRTPTPCDPMMP